MLELLKYHFFINALLGAIFASITCGIIGTYIVSKRIVFISGGISHASFGGIGLGYYLGINPVLGAAIFALLSGISIEYISKKSGIRKDSMIGILWSFGMACGIIFVYITPGYAPDLMTYIFGNILTISGFDIYLMLGLSIIIIATFLLLFKEILYIAFDEEYAKTKGVNTEIINYILICLISLTIVINIRMAGIILVISLLTIPQAIANLISKDFKNIIFLSITFGFIASISGLIISYSLNIPSGPSIIFSLVIIFMILRLIRQIYTKIKIKNNTYK